MSDVGAAPKAKLLPFYLVVDVSWSMDGSKLDAANKIMGELIDALAQAPIISDKVRFAMLDFADDARVQLPLCDILSEDLVVPGLSPRGSTSYAAAFRLLRQEIAHNVAQLKVDGFSVHRPAVFFLTDGEPNPGDGWEQTFAELTEFDRTTKTGFPLYPNVIPFGVDDANPGTLRKLIHPNTGTKAMRMYLMAEGQNPGTAISAMAEILISSVLSSGESVAQGGSGIMLPADEDLPDAVTSHAFDDDDFLDSF